MNNIPHIVDSGASVMNNEPVALTQEDIFGILQDAHSVSLGQPIWNSTEEYNKLKAIIESAIRYTHPVKELDEQFKKGFEAGKEEGWKAHKFHHPVKELTDEEIANTWDDVRKDATLKSSMKDIQDFARAILRKAQEK